MVERTKEEREREAWTGRVGRRVQVCTSKQREGKAQSVSQSVNQSVSRSVSRVTMMRAMVISVERERERESTGGFDA
jgi:hypothetical protein